MGGGGQLMILYRSMMILTLCSVAVESFEALMHVEYGTWRSYCLFCVRCIFPSFPAAGSLSFLGTTGSDVTCWWPALSLPSGDKVWHVIPAHIHTYTHTPSLPSCICVWWEFVKAQWSVACKYQLLLFSSCQ